MKLVEKLMATSRLDTDITALVTEALKSGLRPEEVRDVLARIAGLIDEACE